MAEHTVTANLLLRYDTYINWMNSSIILKQGEAAIAIFPSQDVSSTKIGVKIGNGESYFYELPWIQALAADVYNWAKSSTKPTYTANEISGLDQYIEEHSGETNSTTYRIIYNNNSKQYILQYYDEELQDWNDTTSVIDFSTLLNRIQSIENWANGAYTDIGNINEPLASPISDQVGVVLGRLDVPDAAIEHQFVTSVSQENGRITVVRNTIDAEDISTGVLTTSQGGTGFSSINTNEILIGSSTGNLQKANIATNINNEDINDIPTTGAVISYISQETSGLTGAMHFIGEASITIINESQLDPQITNYNFSNAQLGDVILSDAKEFVWTGSYWRLLGDEGSYAVKGSITNNDIADNANINISKISNLQSLLDNKVTVQEGKDLSSNDYTTEEKTKLQEIENGAQVNTIEHILLNNQEITVDELTKSINITVNEFDSVSQNKLNNIESGAQANIIEKVVYNNTELTPDENKTITINSDPHTEHENKIEQIFINGVEQEPNDEKQVRITFDQASLNLNVLEGATIPNAIGREEVEQSQKKLLLERIAVTGNVTDLKQTNDTYIVLNCGSSTEVI